MRNRPPSLGEAGWASPLGAQRPGLLSAKSPGPRGRGALGRVPGACRWGRCVRGGRPLRAHGAPGPWRRPRARAHLPFVSSFGPASRPFLGSRGRLVTAAPASCAALCSARDGAQPPGFRRRPRRLPDADAAWDTGPRLTASLHSAPTARFIAAVSEGPGDRGPGPAAGPPAAAGAAPRALGVGRLPSSRGRAALPPAPRPPLKAGDLAVHSSCRLLLAWPDSGHEHLGLKLHWSLPLFPISRSQRVCMSACAELSADESRGRVAIPGKA